ncbi:hypothetical protein CMUS01_06837 [Colletotrichum musicola]|uniref:Uncharacterized protein n=1 Tax=Colletotrichum musicola TaxID=2175873 RepID=A0A8H6KJK4_9PEZI|nr:hypothetical protein CMUS01_06837 [Colletotrichum musicola]
MAATASPAPRFQGSLAPGVGVSSVIAASRDKKVIGRASSPLFPHVHDHGHGCGIAVAGSIKVTSSSKPPTTSLTASNPVDRPPLPLRPAYPGPSRLACLVRTSSFSIGGPSRYHRGSKQESGTRPRENLTDWAGPSLLGGHSCF